MADYTLAFQTGFIYGMVFSLLISSLLLVMIKINPEGLLDGLPAEIKARYGPVSEKTQRIRKPFSILFLLIMIGVLLLAIKRYDLMTGGAPTFVDIFVLTFTIFMVFNVVDLIILDWLVICTITPKFIVLPGTEGMAGYKDYGFHFRGFLKGCVICLVSGLVFAGIATLLYFIPGML